MKTSLERKIDKQMDKQKRVKPCETCGNNRWRTLIKGALWGCYRCGRVRVDEKTKNQQLASAA